MSKFSPPRVYPSFPLCGVLLFVPPAEFTPLISTSSSTPFLSRHPPEAAADDAVPSVLLPCFCLDRLVKTTREILLKNASFKAC